MLCAPRAAPSTGPAWLEQAVFYQIYPQSFYDSNGDGVGDIPGITRKLDYLHWLGVNALWINPCFESPFCDAGYDISDYYTVARRYGTNADLETLFARAGDRGIRVLLDLVPGHTSVEHSWFKASCRRERNEYSDWYVWTDGVWKQPEGLRSVNGFAERDGNYITNFFWCQPALNYGFAAPDPRQPWQQPVDAPGPQRVRQELRNIMRFWLHRGASGFRVDMANSLVKKDPGEREVMGLWSDVRGWLDREYPDAALVSEWSNPVHAIPAGFHADFCLMDGGMAGSAALFRKSQRDPYGWSFFDPAGRGNIREFLDEYLEQYEATRGRGFIALVTGNHDVNPRLAEGRSQRDLVCAFTFLLTMPGTPFIYYGDEIGMRSVQGLASKEGGYDRTASRTPMQWDASANAGFSMAPVGQLYLPIDPNEDRPTVADQRSAVDSLLQQVRRLIALRKAHPALGASGDFAPVHVQAGDYPFVYRRSKGEETILVAVNPAARPVEAELPGELLPMPPQTLHGQDGAFERAGARWLLRLPGASSGLYRVSG